MHDHDCGCPRCRGFEAGHELSIKHGAKAIVKLGEHAEKIADELREMVPVRSIADDATISVLAMTLAQIERANIVLTARQREEISQLQNGSRPSGEERDDLRRLASDARGWTNTALRYFETLGLTPTARAKLGLDIARTNRALNVLELHELAEAEVAEIEQGAT